MINKVKKAFGKDNPIVFYGDWSAKHQSKFFAPTPNKRIKRKFVENFEVYNLDEYNTSRLDWLTEKPGDNLEVKDKKKRLFGRVYRTKKDKNGLVKRTKKDMKVILVRGKKGEKPVFQDKKKKLRKLHAVKTFTRNNRLECINRDRNACLNMRKLVLHYLKFGEWKSAYKNPRKTKKSKQAGNNT